MSSRIPALIALNLKRMRVLSDAYNHSVAMARDVSTSVVEEDRLMALAQTHFPEAPHLPADAIQAQSSALMAQAMEKIIQAQMHRLQLHRAFPAIDKLRILFDGHARSAVVNNPEKEHDLKAQTLHKRLLVSISYLDNILGKRNGHIDQLDEILAKAPPKTIDNVSTLNEAGEMVAHYYLKLCEDRHTELEQGLRWTDIGLSTAYLRTAFRAKATPGQTVLHPGSELVFGSVASLMYLHDMPHLLSAAERDLNAARIQYHAPEDRLMDLAPHFSPVPAAPSTTLN